VDAFEAGVEQGVAAQATTRALAGATATQG
jgi:hypothetical protein